VILAAARAEWFKVVRRPAVWVTIGLFLALGVGIDYLLTYLVATHPPSGSVGTGENSVAALRASLYPASLVPKALSSVSSLGGIFAVILGVLIQGSEYAWATLKTSFTQLPGRLTILAGRLIALASLVALMTVSLFGLDALASWAIASIDDTAAAFPAAADIAKGVGGEWLILTVLATFGFVLATIFKQSAMAIGLGLAYTLVIETIVFALIGQLGQTVNQIHTYFLVASIDYLAQSFGYVPEIVGVSVTGRSVDGTHAVVVLCAWIAAFVVAAGLVTHARDVA
jgi:ABC-2 type transport system permease protein